ncbi:MAG: hypothetical protein AAGC55_03940, partial [Myxococcota bacterium]
MRATIDHRHRVLTYLAWAACMLSGPAALAGPDTTDRAEPGPTAQAAAEPGPTAEAEAVKAEAEVTRPGPKALPDLPPAARFTVIELHGEVSLGMASFVDRVTEGLQTGDILIIDISTFGGRVDAAVRIRDALLALEQRDITTIAYVHPRAISAGALISLATDIIAVAPGATMGAATPVRVGGGGEAQPVEEKTVSYMRKEMRATAEAQGRNGDIGEAMVDADVAIPGLSKAGKLLTLDGNEALDWGVASLQAATLDELLAGLGFAPGGQEHTVRAVEWSWAEEVASWLTSSAISGLLMSLGMLGLLIGLYSGGSPLPLAVGGVCLSIFFFGHHIVNLAGVEEIVLFVLGAALILVEVLMPGYIVPAVLGVLFVVLSLLLGLVDFEHIPFAVQWEEGWIMRAVGTVFGAITGTAVLGIAAVQILPGTRFGQALLLDAAIDGKATDPADHRHDDAIGQIAVAESDLRPAGKVKIGTRRYDAV